MAKRTRRKGFEAQLKWISATMKSTADDREEDGDTEPVPVVSLTEEHDTALENKVFCSLLKKIGLKPPASEQERFWRIPGNLKPDDLRSRADYLMHIPGSSSNKKKSNSRIKALQNLAKNRKKEQKAKDKDVRHKRRSASQVACQILNDTALSSQDDDANLKKTSRVKQILDSESEDSDNERLVIDTEVLGEMAVSNKRTRLHGSEDESTGEPSVKKSAKRAKLEDSDKENNQSMLNNIDMDSDDDGDDLLVSSDQKVSSKSATTEAPDLESEDDIPLVSSHRQHKQSDQNDHSMDRTDQQNNDASKNMKKLSLSSAEIIRRLQDSGSDSDVPFISNKTSTKQKESLSKETSPRTGNMRMNVEDSDSDSDDAPLITKTAVNDIHKAGASFPATMLSQAYSDSDSDIEDHIPLKRPTKKNYIASDSDDE